MEYTKVYMTIENNMKMFRGEKVKGSLLPFNSPSIQSIGIIVGNYRIEKLDYPFVLVNPIN